MKLDEKQIHDFAIAVVNSTPVEGDSPESIVQKKLELYIEAKSQADNASQKALEEHIKSGGFTL
ncbi:hypothetical protein [Bacillus haynesii]|uniref:hypothetical protein n=1 Tax=Bacillus haynesii TaxID=1925021 RepID=UPI001F60018B|nr:hypothetical protein [Bacillus haynesii]MCI4128198.1 hypothetical protein [Bacillus haynesii]